MWEETFFLLVTTDEITSEEKLSIQLWDSDARSADDVLGRVEVDILELMKTQSKMVRRADKLRGFEEAQSMPGEIHWSYGFYRKVSCSFVISVAFWGNLSGRFRSRAR